MFALRVATRWRAAAAAVGSESFSLGVAPMSGTVAMMMGRFSGVWVRT